MLKKKNVLEPHILSEADAEILKAVTGFLFVTPDRRSRNSVANDYDTLGDMNVQNSTEVQSSVDAAINGYTTKFWVMLQHR